MPEFDDKGKVALWKNDKKGNDKAPAAKGHFFAHRAIAAGEKIELALWRNESDHPQAPMMTGKISDPQQDKEAPVEDFEDSDIPF